jgi:allophanate hydrolase
MTGPDDNDPLSRTWPAGRPLAPVPQPTIAVPLPAQLSAMSVDWQRAFAAAVQRVVAIGMAVVEVDIAPLLAAGSLLYGGAFVAERYAAVGEFIDGHPGEVDPTVAAIVGPARAVPAYQLVADTEGLDRAKQQALALLGGATALMLPTVGEHPTIAEVAEDPIGVNARLATYTTFCNLLDWCAVAAPAGCVSTDTSPAADPGRAGTDASADAVADFFGVSFLAPAFHDAVVADVAGRFLTGSPPEPRVAGDPDSFAGIPLVVVGAHLSGQPLNHQLAGANLIGTVRTAPVYRMFALDTVPPKPGLLRVDDDGVSVAGELWDVPPLTLATLLAGLPAPMSLGPVQLEDGSVRVGFQCEAIATVGAKDISDYASWPEYLGSDG